MTFPLLCGGVAYFYLYAQMSNKDTVAHEIIQFEAIDRLQRVLNPFRDGLLTNSLLEVIKLFPPLFVDLFTFCGTINSEQVLRAVYVLEPEALSDGDQQLLAFVRQYIQQCDTAM